MESIKVLKIKKLTIRLILSFCITAFLCSCAKLDLESRPSVFSGEYSGSHSNSSSYIYEPIDTDPEELWLIKDYKYTKVSSKNITTYEDITDIASVQVKDLKKGDVVFVLANFSLSNTSMFKSYVQTSIMKGSTTLGQKNISIDKGMKFASSNIMIIDTLKENSESLTYKLRINPIAEYSKWNSDKKIQGGLHTRTTDMDRISVIVYRKYETTKILQAENTPYYLQKVYFATDIQTQGSAGEKLINIPSVSFKKGDLLLLQGQVQLLTVTQDEEGKKSYDYSLNVASELSSAGFSASIPGRKTTNINYFPMTHRFFALHTVSADKKTDLSIRLQGAETKFNLNKDYESFSVWVFRKATKENLESDDTFYYLKSVEVQEYNTVFSKMPTAVKVNDNSDASMIMNLDLGTVREQDILDIKLDSNFSLDYASDDLHQYDFICMFRYPSLKVNSQKTKGVFLPMNTSNIFNVKQDLNLYFTTQASKLVRQETLSLYTTIKGENNESDKYQNEYLNLNNFLINFQQWRKIINLNTIIGSDENEEDENEEEEED